MTPTDTRRSVTSKKRVLFQGLRVGAKPLARGVRRQICESAVDYRDRSAVYTHTRTSWHLGTGRFLSCIWRAPRAMLCYCNTCVAVGATISDRSAAPHLAWSSANQMPYAQAPIFPSRSLHQRLQVPATRPLSGKEKERPRVAT